MLVKRGKIYYARFRFGRRETWISTEKTSERAAQKVYERLDTEFKQKRIAKQISEALIEQAKLLALKKITQGQAQNSLNAYEATIMAEALGIVSDFLPTPPLTAQDLWDKYLALDPDLKPSTLKTKQQRVGKFISWIGDRDCKDISEHDCRKFLDTVGNSSLTRNHYISELSSVWKATSSIKNPWGEHLREKAIVEHKKPFKRDQVAAILKYCRENNLPFWHSAVTIGYYTGLRLIDVVKFRRDQITPDGFVDLIPEKTARTDRRVRIPLQESLKIELAGIAPMGNYFFPDAVKKYDQDRSKITNEFRAILDATKIYEKGYGFHSLRHTFVTEALQAGVDIKHVQAVVGHDAVEVTEGTYYHGEKHADLSA